MKFKLVESKDNLFDHEGLISMPMVADLINELSTIKSITPHATLQLAADGYGIDMFWNEDTAQVVVTKFGKEIYKKESKDALSLIKEVIELLQKDGRLDK